MFQMLQVHGQYIYNLSGSEDWKMCVYTHQSI